MPGYKFKFSFVISTICLLFFAVGCTSIRSTVVQRGADGKYTGNHLSTKTTGVPVKLRVPTHVDISIQEVYYVDDKTGEVLDSEQRILEVADPVTVYEYQLFTVDVPRPLAGSLNLTGQENGFTLDDNQQITGLGGTITDNTISQTAAIFGSDSLGGALANLQSTGTGGSEDLTRQERVIATKRFDISVPNWHSEMNAWVESYMGNCTGKCPVALGCTSCSENTSAYYQ